MAASPAEALALYSPSLDAPVFLNPVFKGDAVVTAQGALGDLDLGVQFLGANIRRFF